MFNVSNDIITHILSFTNFDKYDKFKISNNLIFGDDNEDILNDENLIRFVFNSESINIDDYIVYKFTKTDKSYCIINKVKLMKDIESVIKLIKLDKNVNIKEFNYYITDNDIKNVYIYGDTEHIDDGWLFVCNTLEYVIFNCQKLTTVGDFWLAYCENLKTVVLNCPNLNIIGTYFIYDCNILESVNSVYTLKF